MDPAQGSRNPASTPRGAGVRRSPRSVTWKGAMAGRMRQIHRLRPPIRAEHGTYQPENDRSGNALTAAPERQTVAFRGDDGRSRVLSRVEATVRARIRTGDAGQTTRATGGCPTISRARYNPNQVPHTKRTVTSPDSQRRVATLPPPRREADWTRSGDQAPPIPAGRTNGMTVLQDTARRYPR